MLKSSAHLAPFLAPPATTAEVIPLTAHPRHVKGQRTPAELAGMLNSLQRLRMQLKRQLEPIIFDGSLPTISSEDYFDLRRRLTHLVIELARLAGGSEWSALSNRAYGQLKRQYLTAFVLARFYLRVSRG